MPLYIRDAEIDELVAKVMRINGAKTKTEAVRKALQAALENRRTPTPICERIRPLQSRVAALGATGTDFDMKAFSDEL